ncbi:PREDICTED: uncharacterized protein LOC109169067 isoform X2 [Ipomoea nil]|uniref:uncharacterized protein LOC109169067 isoform X2 n=1 Tax=Ipomoea nil TaxID=35883 RepID=UPI000900D6E6|nr:PREDICTED: uncharacterized protein LOC109169067 isoform X2 [Ipomoea nil]
MAAEPVKSQPLHNFSLAHLKWGHRSHHSSSSASNQRFRRRDSPPSAADLQTQLNANTVHRRPSPPSGDAELESGPKLPPPEFPFSLCSTQKRHGEENVPAVVPEEGETKALNLRPRKASGTPSARNSEMRETNCVVDKKLRGIAEGAMERKEKMKKKKRKFWISLSREEIEEDVYSLTGSRPSRRPKKRPKAVQKLVDNVFPGLYLVGLTVDSYRVHESLK